MLSYKYGTADIKISNLTFPKIVDWLLACTDKSKNTIIIAASGKNRSSALDTLNFERIRNICLLILSSFTAIICAEINNCRFLIYLDKKIRKERV